MTTNENICGWYPDLRDRVNRMLNLGLTKTAFCKACNEPDLANSSIARWVAGKRPLNHAKVPVVERAIDIVKAQFAEI